MADSTTPLCDWGAFAEGPLSDLGRSIRDVSAQADLLMEATRLCEQAANRRLAPFTGLVETHRADGVDPDEYTDSANLPLDLAGTVGRSYAYALGASTLVRHCWLNEYAPRHADLWTYSDVSITIVRSYGGSEDLGTAQYQGPEPDSGHVWFNLGKFIPIGSLVRAVYSGGYTVAIPADLVRACKYMTASLILTELQPSAQTRDPGRLSDEAEKICAGYGRD